MMVGIIAEGWADVAVIRNILKGMIGLDGANAIALRPELNKDETDLAGYHQMNPEEYSNWTIVKQECQNRTAISGFLGAINNNSFVVIHIDAAESELQGYDVPKPDLKTKDYCLTVRNSIIEKINEWLETEYSEQVKHAIAIQETDAWLIPLFEENNKIKPTHTYPNSKEKLDYILNKGLTDKQKRIYFDSDIHGRYHERSKAFRKMKELKSCFKYSEDLKLFCESLPPNDNI